ncbi:MAG TPA: hypothetical protein V6C71_21075 [Coleofasciculaceae cyanobacterium]|jgi:hypothetical protein
MSNKYNIATFSEYHSVEKPTKKLLEQVSDVIRLKHYTHVLNRGGRGVISPLNP